MCEYQVQQRYQDSVLSGFHTLHSYKVSLPDFPYQERIYSDRSTKSYLDICNSAIFFLHISFYFCSMIGRRPFLYNSMVGPACFRSVPGTVLCLVVSISRQEIAPSPRGLNVTWRPWWQCGCGKSSCQCMFSSQFSFLEHFGGELQKLQTELDPWNFFVVSQTIIYTSKRIFFIIHQDMYTFLEVISLILPNKFLLLTLS